ncbi:MAG TPA: sorbosone dehydrogenase family protein [Methylomirabilota bacterium]|nr:sorbosone dehydrogenase family protein [Methylomirabilota bacterium]
MDIRALAAVVGLAFFATPAESQDLSSIKLPPGFVISTFAKGLGSARFMALDPNGTLVVSITRGGKVLALPDRDGNGRADTQVVILDDLDSPHGLAFQQGFLYVAETGRILRYRYNPATMIAAEQTIIVRNLPRGGGHFTRTLVVGPDEKLYVSVGSSCNVCEERDKRRASIVRYNPDGSGEVLFATGLRNAVGITFRPGTTELWATNNGRDWLGDDLPPEYVTEVKEGGFYGWPYCYSNQGKIVPDPDYGSPERCQKAMAPNVEFQAHSAPLGLTFYQGDRFPPEYRGNIFVALHGSWNRSVPTGYKLLRIVLKNGKPERVEDFAWGWLEGRQRSGRPVDVLTGKDGALYVSDDTAGQIYRISYK